MVGLVGGAGDRALALRVAEQRPFRDRIMVLAGRLTIPQTAGVLAEAALFVGGDSGLAHLAPALNVPAVVMFGPSDARKWCRESEAVAVVRKDVACAPCFIFGYHKYCRSITCMKQIEVAEVLEACRKVVRRPLDERC